MMLGTTNIKKMNEEILVTTSFIQCKNHINKLSYQQKIEAFRIFISKTPGDVGEKHLPKNVKY